MYFISKKVYSRSFICDISNYTENYNYILKNSMNNFKKLEKKQTVRLNFIQEVKKLMAHYESCDREKEE